MESDAGDLLESLGRHADLGHEKRNEAFVRQVMLACEAAGGPVSLAGREGGRTPWADLLSLYRFVDNGQVALPDLRAARAAAIMERLPSGSDVMVVHDVSLMDYSRHNAKEDRRPIGDGRGRGYEYVPCLAVDPLGGTVLGALHDTLVDQTGPDDADTMRYDDDPLFADFSAEEAARLRRNHRHQMGVHIRGLAPLLSRHQAIHVADREFDDIFILLRARTENADFVIRSTALRNVQVPDAPWLPAEARTRRQGGHPAPPGWVHARLDRLARAVPLQPYKALPLDAAGRVTDASCARRVAHLSIGACCIRLYRPAKRNKKYYPTPAPVEVHLVVIRELQPPPGETPLCWVLLTSLPVDTPEQLARVGRIYELRWRVENFFRLLKEGYKIERSKLDSAPKIARLLVILSVAATILLNVKEKLGLPAQGPLPAEQHQHLKHAIREPNNPDIEITWRLLGLVARLGGWLERRRDPLGPALLMRGLLRFVAILDAAETCAPLIAEARQNPHVLRRLFCV